MRAILNRRYGAAEDLRLAEIDPPALEPDHAVVRVRAASVNAGDWRLMRGWPRIARPMMGGLRGPSPPVRGWDLAGVVESVADGVEGLAPGDEVFGTGGGTFAELATARADTLAPKPAWLSYEQAAAIGVAGVTALQSLRDRARVEPGQRVLVTGAGGGVGTFAVQIAKAYGAEVTAVCSAAKADLVKELGADRVIDYRLADFTRDRGRYDVILDIGSGRSLRATRRALAGDGMMIVMGGKGNVVGPIARIAGVVILKQFARGQKLMPFLARPTRADLLELAGLIEAGKLRVAVDRTFQLAEAPAAIRYVEDGHVRGKAVVLVS
ncbi:MAG TPA: NAD(P)-dependent alcohol dehydrogenase [Gaiellaceae bacterium]|nr:NAD(P)-dependent alcohol dehydrogenase [Gaiellaceae bacterium]